MYFSSHTVHYLRIVAIITLIWYYMQPNIFPQGYVCADIYFVTIGYILASHSIPTLSNFCIAQLRFLVPLYLLSTCITLIASLFLFPSSFFEFVKTETFWAAIFSINLEIIWNKKGFYKQILSFKLYQHLWVFAIEMQFYLLVIIIFSFIPLNKNFSKAILVLGIFSFISQIWFKLRFEGIWQISLGFATMYSDHYKALDSLHDIFLKISKPLRRKIFIFILWLFLMVVIMLPIKNYLPSTFIRLISSFICCLVLITFENQTVNNKRSYNTLDRKVLYPHMILNAYYIVHWPVFIFLKFTLNVNPIVLIILTLLITTFIALLLFHIVEKLFNNSKALIYSCGLLLLYTAIIILCYDKRVNSYVALNNLKFPESMSSNYSDLVITIKTTKANHETRVLSILKTWYQFNQENIYFITDTDDVKLNESLNGKLINSHCKVGHDRWPLICKMAIELKILIEKNATWSCHFDDDNYVNIPLLLKTLAQFDPDVPYYIGKRSVTRMMTANNGLPIGKKPFKFGTGGAGVCLSYATIQMIAPKISINAFQNIAKGTTDDVAFGMFMNNLMRINLTEMKDFHSHLEDLTKIPINQLYRKPVLSHDAENKNLISLPYLFDPDKDVFKFLTLHCYLFPALCNFTDD